MSRLRPPGFSRPGATFFVLCLFLVQNTADGQRLGNAEVVHNEKHPASDDGARGSADAKNKGHFLIGDGNVGRDTMCPDFAAKKYLAYRAYRLQIKEVDQIMFARAGEKWLGHSNYEPNKAKTTAQVCVVDHHGTMATPHFDWKADGECFDVAHNPKHMKFAWPRLASNDIRFTPAQRNHQFELRVEQFEEIREAFEARAEAGKGLSQTRKQQSSRAVHGLPDGSSIYADQFVLYVNNSHACRKSLPGEAGMYWPIVSSVLVLMLILSFCLMCFIVAFYLIESDEDGGGWRRYWRTAGYRNRFKTKPKRMEIEPLDSSDDTSGVSSEPDEPEDDRSSALLKGKDKPRREEKGSKDKAAKDKASKDKAAKDKPKDKRRGEEDSSADDEVSPRSAKSKSPANKLRNLFAPAKPAETDSAEKPKDSADSLKASARKPGKKLADLAAPKDSADKAKEAADKVKDSARKTGQKLADLVDKPKELVDKGKGSAERSKDSARKPGKLADLAEKPREAADKLKGRAKGSADRAKPSESQKGPEDKVKPKGSDKDAGRGMWPSFLPHPKRKDASKDARDAKRPKDAKKDASAPKDAKRSKKDDSAPKKADSSRRRNRKGPFYFSKPERESESSKSSADPSEESSEETESGSTRSSKAESLHPKSRSRSSRRGDDTPAAPKTGASSWSEGFPSQAESGFPSQAESGFPSQATAKPSVSFSFSDELATSTKMI